MITLQCKSCGGSLEFDPSDPCIICRYCNAEYLRTDSFVQDVINNHIRLAKIRASLDTALKTDNYAMQYKCLSILYNENQHLENYHQLLLEFYDILTGTDVTMRFLNKLSKDFCNKLFDILDNIPDTYNLNNKPISKLAIEFFLKAYRDNNYSNPFRDNASMSKTKLHKRKNTKLYLIIALLFAGLSAWILYLQAIALFSITAISLSIGLFVYFVLYIMHTTSPIMHTACQSQGLPAGSMLYIYQDGFVITRHNKPDIFLFQGIERVFLQASGVLTFILGNQMTSVTISLPNLDAVDIQRIITFANTKIKNLGGYS